MERLKSLDWYWQLVVLLGVAGLIYFLVYYFVTSDTRLQTQALAEQVSQLQIKNKAAESATEYISEFRSLYVSKQQEYEDLKVLLPEQREITNVLSNVQETERESNLTLVTFKPKEDIQQDFIMAKPVDIEVESNYNNLRVFFDKIAKLERIVSITDFSLKQIEMQSGNQTIRSQFSLTAYYASPETLNNTNKPAVPTTPGTPTVPSVPTTPPVTSTKPL